MPDHPFLSGVVEGFYGQPWTQPQRKGLLAQLSNWGMNTYLYAPKDDLKHRAIWRESYTNAELATIGDVVDQCAQRSITFVYGLSPGLDIRFSEPAELEAVKRRFRQLQRVGTKDFALLFDDLPGEMHRDDVASYDSLAAAQSAVTNSVFKWLRTEHPQARLLFCPTCYCGRMDREGLGGAEYLDTIGRSLSAEIDVLWTGPEIVSREIPLDSIRRVSRRIGRPPVIWDNLHANDYDLRRLFCGPYSGRSPQLLEHVRGILANPNNELPINYVPLRTLGRFLSEGDDYNPRQAFLSGIAEWLKHFATVRSPISCEDLVLLADCYYLPHEDGSEAIKLRRLTAKLLQAPVDKWGDDFLVFTRLHQRIQGIFENLTELQDRHLFYAWSRRVWELKEELDLIQKFLEKKKAGIDLAGGIAVDSHLAGTYRGGIVARLQRWLTMDSDGTFRLSQISESSPSVCGKGRN